MTLRLLQHQLRYEQRTYWRNPGGVFFTIALTVLLLVIFTSLNRDDIDPVTGRSFAAYFVPGILTFGVISTTYGTSALGWSSGATVACSSELGARRSPPLPCSVACSSTAPSSLS